MNPGDEITCRAGKEGDLLIRGRFVRYIDEFDCEVRFLDHEYNDPKTHRRVLTINALHACIVKVEGKKK